MELVQPSQINDRFSFFYRNSDVVTRFGTMAILMVVIIPILTFLFDLLLTFNITFSLMILPMGMLVLKPSELSAFPLILMMATLFRLSFNISSTRIFKSKETTGSEKYEANCTSDIFHEVSCKSVSRMNQYHILAFDGSWNAKTQGFKPCRMYCAELFVPEPCDRVIRTRQTSRQQVL